MIASDAGILNINKPQDWSSFQAVSLVRRLTGLRRVGHAGTLDPMATGVLIVCFGKAVRIIEYLMELPKTYRAEITLGATTDTYDAAGRMTSQKDAASIDEPQIHEALRAFEGEVEQVPPAFSAVKRGGRPAYVYARRGEPVRLEPRRAIIYRIELLDLEPPNLTIEVECGKGTYVRSLAHDLGQNLGCGAYLRSLTRLKVGPFAIQDAKQVEQLEAVSTQGTVEPFVLPVDYGLSHLPSLTLDSIAEDAICHGRYLPANVLPASGNGPTRAYSKDGKLVAIVIFDGIEGLWRPVKVLA